MTPLDYLNLLMRWTHIMAAITAAGGTIFVLFALTPALQTLPASERQSLSAAIRSRWAKVLMVAIAALLISGLYNIGIIEATTTAPKQYAWYRPIFGIKFLLAMVLFFIGSLLVGRTGLAERLRQKSTFWLNVNLALIVVVVLLSGVLRTAVKTPKNQAPPTAAAALSGGIAPSGSSAGGFTDRGFAARALKTALMAATVARNRRGQAEFFCVFCRLGIGWQLRPIFALSSRASPAAPPQARSHMSGAMNPRSEAIQILQQARDLLTERLTQRVCDSREQILEDAEGGSYLSEIEAIYEQMGGRLAHLNAMLSNLPAAEEPASAETLQSAPVFTDVAAAGYSTTVEAPPIIEETLALPAPESRHAATGPDGHVSGLCHANRSRRSRCRRPLAGRAVCRRRRPRTPLGGGLRRPVVHPSRPVRQDHASARRLAKRQRE